MIYYIQYLCMEFIVTMSESPTQRKESPKMPSTKKKKKIKIKK